ncbi:hypothetical protein Scep_028091 [Stephania cephalantha]|uniref:Uncharacterized protein n=1 Tax=Stephania cephalantha TaxID=152367 RepID=A0AAP0HJ72_9MAGN
MTSFPFLEEAKDEALCFFGGGESAGFGSTLTRFPFFVSATIGVSEVTEPLVRIPQNIGVEDEQ